MPGFAQLPQQYAHPGQRKEYEIMTSHMVGSVYSGLCNLPPFMTNAGRSELFIPGYGLLPRANNSQSTTPYDHCKKSEAG